MRFSAKVDEKGRLSVPRQVRELAGWQACERVSLVVEGHDVRVLRARDQAERFRGFVKGEPGRDLTSELIADRREEAARESAEAPRAHEAHRVR